VHADNFPQSAKIKKARAQYFLSLKSKKAIGSVFKTGGKVFAKMLMLRFNRSSESNPPFQVVFAVSAKLGDAHVRNRIKRRLREALHEVLKTGTVKQAGFDLAIIPKKETADADFGNLCADLKMALGRLPKHKDVQGAGVATDGGLSAAPKGDSK
jgi:ribonuclease P protein component